VLIAHVFYGGDTATPSTPTNWTLLDGPRSLNTPATNGRTWVYGKVAVGSDADPAFGTQAVTTPRRARVYSFSGALSDTISNIVGGFGFDGPASSATINDVGVTTGADAQDYLAVNLIAVTDDNAVASFTGETGGDWTEAVAEFTGTTGTPDTCMQVQTAVVAPSTTINGGSQTMAASDPWGVTGFYIRSKPPKTTAPTQVATSTTGWNATTPKDTADTLTWETGDEIYVIGMDADAPNNTLGTPTATGLTFNVLSGFPIGGASNAEVYAWKAVAGSGGSDAITGSRTAGSDDWGMRVWQFRGSDGTGVIATLIDSAHSLSLARGDDHSRVICGIADWSADADVTVTATPSSGGTVRDAVQTGGTGIATYFTVDWTDQGSAGSTSYGVANATGAGSKAKAAIEVLGSTGAPPVEGQASGAFSGTHTAAGVPRALGAASGAFGGTHTAAGVPRTPGAAAGAFGGTHTANGTPRPLGAAVGAWGFTATASGETGTPPVTGQAVGDFGGTHTAAGTPRVLGTAVGSFGWSGTAAGVDRALGQAASDLGFAGTAVGVDRALGQAANDLGFSGTAAGVDRALGQATGDLGFAGAAQGFAGTPPVTGQAVGSFGWSGTAAGIDRALGLAASDLGFAGTALGLPKVRGQATGDLGFAAVGAGRVRVSGAAVGSFGWTGTAAGEVPSSNGIILGHIADNVGSMGGRRTAAMIGRVT
jgi:hypothetical protein